MFNAATRQNIIPAPSITYAAGQTLFSVLPKVGLLKRVILLFTGTLTVTLGGGTAVLGAEAPWSLLTRLRLTANGNTALFDMTGWGSMIASLFGAYGYSGIGGRPRIPDSATVPGPAATAFAAANFGAGVSAGANTWKPPVISAIAHKGEGLPELLEVLKSHYRHLAERGGLKVKRLSRRRERIRQIVEGELHHRFWNESRKQMLEEALGRDENPFAAASLIVKSFMHYKRQKYEGRGRTATSLHLD